MITFHYPLLCHREYQLKQTKLFWCLWSISAGWMFAGMLLRFLWMSSNVHFDFIWEASTHKVPSLIPNFPSGGKSPLLEAGRQSAGWSIDFGVLAVWLPVHRKLKSRALVALLLIQVEDYCAAVVPMLEYETWPIKHTHTHTHIHQCYVVHNALKEPEHGLTGAAG